MTATPFIKWAGGKRRLLPLLLERMPRSMSTYYEPFVGGGALFFALAAERRFECAVLGDQNAALIEVYTVVRDRVDALIRALRPMAEHATDPDFFYATRAASPRTAVRRAARFIFLNKTCFNGLYRVNRSGAFNVPFGRYKNPCVFETSALRAASAVLQNVELVVGDFANTLAHAKPSDAVYLDPPYVPRSATSRFTSYTTEGFGADDHERLAEHFAALRNVDVTAILSNACMPFTKKLYRKHKVLEVSVGRTISSAGHRREPVMELIVSHRAKRRRARSKRRAA